ncbi:glutathione S-transferase T3-like protein [Tanacetum coccineum]
MYDAVCGKWKTVSPSVIRFSRIYSNAMRMAQESGAKDEDYVQRAMIHYEIEIEIPFKLRHCWEILKDLPKWQEIATPKFSTGSGGSKRHKSSGSSSFNTESGEASINLNTNVGDNDEDEVHKIRRPKGRDKARGAGKNKGSKASGSSTVNKDALARLMVTEMASQEKEERLAFLKIKMREVECRERKIEQQDMMFYLQPYDHLTGDQRNAMDEIRAKIKVKYNLQY